MRGVKFGGVSTMEAIEMDYFMDMDCKETLGQTIPLQLARYKAPVQTLKESCGKVKDSGFPSPLVNVTNRGAVSSPWSTTFRQDRWDRCWPGAGTISLSHVAGASIFKADKLSPLRVAEAFWMA